MLILIFLIVLAKNQLSFQRPKAKTRYKKSLLA
jgi:hypothetical protein